VSVFVGTSGYSYAPWKGVFYPPKLPAAKMLSFYASRFRTVELNSTFYRMPKTEVFEQWRGEVPPGFVFAVKSTTPSPTSSPAPARWEPRSDPCSSSFPR
jgi:uncharacterized protein YecE (DUF72 family)